MPTLRSAWVWVDMSPANSVANLNSTVCKPVPVAGTIKKVRVGQLLKGAAASGTFVLSKSGVNILSAASTDLYGDYTTAAVAQDLVLTTKESTLKVATTDTLNALYTLTTCAITSAIGLYVAIEPDEW